MGSGIQDLEKTHSGSRIQGSKRNRIPDPDPQHQFTGNVKSLFGLTGIMQLLQKFLQLSSYLMSVLKTFRNKFLS
jgi:hypothetical protein